MRIKKVVIFLLLACLLPFSARLIEAKSYSSFYLVKQGKVYYVHGSLFEDGEPDTDALARFELAEADPASFVIIDNTYAKDQAHVFRCGKILPGRDAPSFQLVSKDTYKYSKDRLHVYFLDEPIPGADPATFTILDAETGYSKDERQVFYLQALLAGADPVTAAVPAGQSSSLIQGGNYYLKDARHVYYKGKLIAGADASSFTFILDPRTATTYAKDKTQVFYQQQLVVGADPASFAPVIQQGDGGIAYAEGWFADQNSIFWAGQKVAAIDRASLRFLEPDAFEPAVFLDKDQVFFHTAKIEGADPATFILLGKGYAKDDRHVYYEEHILPGALPASFRLVGGSHYLWYGKDKKSVFINEKKNPGAHPKSFRLIDNHSYSRDRKQIFYVGEPVLGADPESFRKADFQYEGWAAEKVYHQDKRHVFFDFKIIPESDPESFVLLQPFFAQDKRHVYYEGKVIPLLDPASFRILDAHYGDFEDDKYKYRRWQLVQA